MRTLERLRLTLSAQIETGTRHRLVLAGLILGALLLRLARIAFQPLWWDEGWSLYFAATDLRTMLELTAVDIHPPLYYVLLSLWGQAFGFGVLPVRLLSVLIGVAAVLLLYAVGRRVLGERGGLLAALLLAISPFAIYYSQEVRMYGLVALFGLAALHFALRWQDGNWGLGSWLGYVLVSAAALYTQYYAAFLLLALNLVILIHWLRERRKRRECRTRRERRTRRGLLPWLAAQVVVLLLYLPWLGYAGEKLLTYVRFKVGVEEDLSLGALVYLGRHLATFTWGHAEGALAGWWWLGLLSLGVLLVALALGLGRGLRRAEPDARQGQGWGWPLLVVLAVMLACGFAVNLALPFNPPRLERLLLPALPAFLLLVAGGLLALWRWSRSAARVVAAAFGIAVLVSLAFFYTVPRYPDDDYRPLAARIEALGLPGDAIVCVHPWQVGYFQSYLPDDDARPALFLTPREVIPRERQVWYDDPARMAADLDALLAEHGRLWFPDHQSMGRVLERRIEAYLAANAYHTFSQWQGVNTVLSFFAAGETAPQPAAANFGGWLDLEGAALSPDPLEAGWDVLAVDLAWTLSNQPAEDYTVGLRLAGPTGHVWAQRDHPPGGGLEQFADWAVGATYFDRHGLLIPAGTPPGDYQITLRIYRSQDVAVLPVTFEGGSGGEVALGTVRVVRPEEPPPVEALEFDQARRTDWAGRLRLWGYTLHTTGLLRHGESAAVELFWQALADPGEDFLPRLQLLDGEGRVLAELTEKPVAGTYPTAWWRAGELVRDPHALPIPAAVPAGRHRLALSLIRAADGSVVESEGGEVSIDLGEIEVVDRPRRFEPTSPQHVQVAQFGSGAALAGYDLDAGARAPGSPLAVTLHWQAIETPDRNYHTFVHLLDGEEKIVAQHDGPPGDGQFPTLGWLPGEYLLDPHFLQLPPNLPAGTYRLGVGFYDPATNIRLGDRAILNTSIEVIHD